MVDHEARRGRLREQVVVENVDAILVTSLVNVRYLTGFSGSNAALLVPADAQDDVLISTDGRYTTQVAAEAPDVPVLIARVCAGAVLEQAVGRGFVHVGFEAEHLTVAALTDLRSAVPTLHLVPLTGTVESHRVVKDESELELLREACAISSAALEAMLAGEQWAGRTERDLAASLELRMRQLGADGVAFDTIVGSGPNSAVPHHEPTDRRLLAGDLVVVDFGAKLGGYHADMTRTLVVGTPADWQIEIFDLVTHAQRAGREALVAAARCGDVDLAARAVIDAAGYAAEFCTGTGHGVGLEIHEAPMVLPGATGRLRDSMPVTVEPGVYLPGRGGVRIEDTLVVAGETPVTLTTTSNELHILR